MMALLARPHHQQELWSRLRPALLPKPCLNSWAWAATRHVSADSTPRQGEGRAKPRSPTLPQKPNHPNLSSPAARPSKPNASAKTNTSNRSNTSNKPNIPRGSKPPPGDTSRTPNSVRRYTPDNIKHFFRNGTLLTTSENLEWFQKTYIQPDNGTMTRFAPTTDVRRVAQEFNITLAFSRMLVMHPHHIRYFDPRGHALTASMKTKYEVKVMEAPFWMFSTSAGSAAAVVRLMTQRRLKRAVYKALEDLGYMKGGKGNGREILGTLWITVHDPIKAANLPAEQFGKAVAAALVSECSQVETILDESRPSPGTVKS